MRPGVFIVLTATLFCFGCASPRRPAMAIVEPIRDPDPYVRLLNTSNSIQLQIAARKFDAPRSRRPSIWLVGVSHIGEAQYFAALQQQLDEQTVVLFEGISNSNSPATSSNSETNAEPERAGDHGEREKLSSLQVSMADTLGLVFQLQAIDYRRGNFLNSDLSIQQLREIIAQMGNGASFESLLQMMEGGSWLDTFFQVALRFLSASPKLQGLAKVALMETIDAIQGDPGKIQGLPPELKQLLEVLISKRDEKVLDDVKIQLARMGAGDSIAIFYGTGHMPDLETRVRKELKYHPTQEKWFTAFSVDKGVAGVTESEREFVRSFIQRQFQPSSAAPKQ